MFSQSPHWPPTHHIDDMFGLIATDVRFNPVSTIHSSLDHSLFPSTSLALPFRCIFKETNLLYSTVLYHFLNISCRTQRVVLQEI